MDEAKSDSPRQMPGTEIELSGPEITAYNAAAEAIQYDLSRISSLRERVTRLEQVHWHKPDSKPYARVTFKRNAEIAAILNISERTVEKHGAEIFIGLQAENRATAIVRALEFCAAARAQVNLRT